MAFILKVSPECVKSELELFNLSGTQTVIQDGQWKQFHPLSNVFDNAPVEFHISGSAEDYIDLSQTQLYVKAKIVKVDNTPITKDDTIGPVNLFLYIHYFLKCERKLEKEAGKRKRVDLSVSSRKKKTQLFTSAENSTADPENIFLPPKENEKKIDLLLRKGVFPYDYFDSFEKCKDSCLPPISKFYNKLNEEAISVEDYNHACKVFNEFHLNNLGEYCDLYVKTDVLLLTDLFENFRKICMQTYKLDPCWYFTTPALSWDAMLLHTKVAIELFTDYDVLLFIEKGVRGGISQCCNRYAIANNRYMSNFNPDDEIKYLMYLDANNLYGYAMSKYLPLKDFVWSDNDLTEQDILNLSDESDVGYILEVDLEYPSDLHDKHSDFPLAPENKPPPNCKESLDF
ncbi:uncharacterized protein TNCV_4684541 [Trichonephila clavipes]|nr:uncharacterized protein TNCV_4684541 [Trichonephila clavipes]